MKTFGKDTTAVLVIDMQDFFLDKFRPEKRRALIEQQSKVIDFCSKHQIAIILLEYKDRGQTTASLRHILKKGTNVNVEIITKDSNGGFTNTDLDEVLKHKNVKNIVLMGINGSGCIQDTAIGALNRGYKILTSGEVIASSTNRDRDLATSRKWYSKKGHFFESTDELLAQVLI